MPVLADEDAKISSEVSLEVAHLVEDAANFTMVVGRR